MIFLARNHRGYEGRVGGSGPGSTQPAPVPGEPRCRPLRPESNHTPASNACTDCIAGIDVIASTPHPRPRLALDRGLGARDLKARLTTTTDTSNVARRRLPRAGDHSQKSRVLVH